MHWHERLPIIRLLVRAAGPVLGRLVEDRGFRVVSASVVAIRSLGVLLITTEQLARATPIEGIQHIIIHRLHRFWLSRRRPELHVEIGPIMDLLADRRMRLQDLPHLRLEAVLGRDHLVFRVLRVVGLDERVHEVAAGAHFPLLRERDLERLS